MVNTTLIIEVIAIIFLLGIISYIAFVMFGPNNPTPTPGGKCPSGQTNISPYGCITCPSGNPTTCIACSKDGDCNGGKCIPVSSGKGVCSCPPGKFGANCEKECDSNTPCKNGQQCQNGICIGGKECDCKKQGFDTTKYTCSSGSKKCDTCVKGWGPGYPSCYMKEYTDLTLPTKHCHKAGDSKDEWDGFCKQDYPGSEYVGPVCSASQSGCFFRNIDRVGICKIPKAYALPTFDNYANTNACDPNKAIQFKLWGGYVPS